MYTNKSLQQILGTNKIDLSLEYVLETHRGAKAKLGMGGFREVGKVDDYSLNEEGTMIVLERLPAPKPKVPISKAAPKVAKVVAKAVAKVVKPLVSKPLVPKAPAKSAVPKPFTSKSPFRSS